MYGMIHQAARDFAVARLGIDEWEALAGEEGMDSRQFIGVAYYPDDETMRLVSLIAGRLGTGLDATLEALGRHWIDFAAASAYGRALKLAGSDLETFLGNLDRMHASIKSNMPLAALPGFELMDGAPGALRVRYRSERPGLAPFAKGILEAVAERLGEPVAVAFDPREDGGLFTLARLPAEVA